ncbi:MAG: SusC/RagA family TonB-linked outer membrane protein [Prevotella sp.]|nr:SusC/RagA family TonB-linked outer membrane protein [Prevotella sp.]
MNSTISEMWQACSLRLATCTLLLGLSAGVSYAQTDDEEEDPLAALKRPESAKLAAPKYATVELTGTVIDQHTGKPLPGVQLQALGYERYTAMTEDDGSFTIKVPTFATALYVHAPQYTPQQVAVKAGDATQTICIKMLADKFRPMYGKDITYTAQRSTTIDRFGITIENELAAELGADMRSVTRSALAEGGAAMFIRGLSSLTCDAQPLVVIDGIEQDMQRTRQSLHDGQFNNLLANISPDDIEKVTVLKNATALYGARGAAGVILIETKRGHSMATRIDANVGVGFQLLPKLPTMMNAQQYRIYASEMLGTVSNIQDKDINFHFLNDDPAGYYYHTYHNDTNWKDEVYRKALTQNYSINVQGGDDIGMYNLSVGYVKAQNTVKESDFDRLNVRFNTDIKLTWFLSTKFDIALSRTNSKLFDDGLPADLNAGTVTSPTALALIKAPIVSPYQYNKLINGGQGGFTSLLSGYDEIFSQLGNQYSLANPVAILENGTGDNKNKAENTYFTVRLAPTLELSNYFKLSADLSYSLNRMAQRYYRPYEGVPPFQVSQKGRVTSMTGSMFVKEQNFMGKIQLDWARQFGASTWHAYIGGRYNRFSYDNSDLSTEYTSSTSDKNPALSTTGYPGVEGINDVWKNIQWYANVDYNFKNRYLLTASVLAEANSRFGENADGMKVAGVKWALFPSVQAGWVLTNESWFPKMRGVDYLRLNAGWDMSGNDGISNYAARTSFTTVKLGTKATGIQLTNIGNDKVRWETTTKWNVGMEGNFINNRLSLTVDYFIHNTRDLLTLKTFSNPIGGINRYWSNGGKLQNQGFEVAFSFKPVATRHWFVEMGASVGHYVNKVKELPDGQTLAGGMYGTVSSIYGQDNIVTAVGSPVAMFYGYKTEGVFASDAEALAAGNGGYLYVEDNAGQRYSFKAGDVHFSDLNGDGKIDDGDKIIIGNPNPDIYGNIFINAGWKRLTLNVGLNYSLGNDIYNYQRSVLNSGSNFFNQQVASTGRWRYEGQQAELPRAAFGDPMGNNRFSDRWIEDGSYLRLKSVRLDYQIPIPESWTSWLQGISVWAEAQNLLTLTKYTGCDPETSVGNSVLYQGIDAGLLPQSRAFMAGLKINL